MTHRIAWGGWLAGVALLVAGDTLHLVHRLRLAGHGYGGWLAVTIISLAFSSVGAVVADRRPANPVGWLFLAVGLGCAVQVAAAEYAAYARFVVDGGLPGAAVGALSSKLAVAAAVSLLPFVLVVFPTGRLLTTRWRWAPPVFGLLAAVGLVATAVTPGELQPGIDNPLGLTVGRDLGPAPVLWLFVGLPVGVVSLVLRWRRSGEDEREQIKWVIFAGATGIGALLLASVLIPVLGDWVGNVGWTVGLTALPVAAGISILRYRLYDIDRIVSRTVSYAVLTGLLVAFYVGSVTAVTRVTPGGNSLAVAGSTLAVAALFQPLRRRVQAGVDHRFNRSRYDATRTIDAFSARLRGEVDLASLRADLLGVVRRTMQPAAVGLWLREFRP